MPLSWNEIRHRAIVFSKDWMGVTREAAERQTFWNEFFNVFGVRRRTVATFEEPVKKLSGDWGFIDLFWPGRLLVEHKSAGEDLGKAHTQGMAYIRGLKDTGRDREIPRWLIVSDFARIALHDLEPEQDPDAPLFNRLPASVEFPLADFHKFIRHFAFVAGYTQHRLNPEDPANLEATQLMCNLHDALEAGGYTGHELKRFLVRILFCLFSDDNGIFPHSAKDRRQIGAHYTAEKNILKLIRSLFLDELRAEFEGIEADRSTRRAARLQEFQDKLARLRFFDPACGCGNFLVLTYRELRKLELEALLELHTFLHNDGTRTFQHEMSLGDVNRLSKLDVHQFYGIEIEEFPARIAEVALWLTDHQANVALSQAFGQFYQRLPLQASPHIHVGNALRMDWRQVLPPAECSYILGNPPFVGKQFMTAEQKADMDSVCGHVKGSGVLDYVTGWYFKAADFVKGSGIHCAFVSTNSISQGEQPGILWGELYSRHNVKIHFAHRTFPWESEARGKAHVHVVIIGFGATDVPAKFITDYDTDLEHPTRAQASNINPYLVEGSDTVLSKRGKPLSAVPEIAFGSMPNDGGHLLLEPEDRTELIRREPGSERFIRQFFGPDEFIKGKKRYCLWLVGVAPNELRTLPHVMQRVESVRGDERRHDKCGETGRFMSTWLRDAPCKPSFILIAICRCGIADQTLADRKVALHTDRAPRAVKENAGPSRRDRVGVGPGSLFRSWKLRPQ